MKSFVLALALPLITIGPGLLAQTDPQAEDLTRDDVLRIVRSALAEEDLSANGGSWTVGAKNRLQIDSPDGRFSFRVHGKVHQHWTAWSADDEFAANGAPLEDSAYIRRARLGVSGLLWENVAFKAEYDLASSSVSAADVYLELREFDFAKIRVGHFYEPFGFDVLTSDNDSFFVERTSGENGETPNRNTGFMVHNGFGDGSGTWAVGAFRNTDGNGRIENDGHFNFTGRATYLPYDDTENGNLIHVGLATSMRDPENSQVQFAAEAEARLGEDVVDTGVLASDEVQLYGLEFCGIHDQFAWQSEYITAMTDVTGASDAQFDHYYAQVAYVITGEQRAYSRSKGAFGGVKPAKNFGEDGGLGAFEAALRYSVLDFNDSGIDGGLLEQVTIGANWYLNPNVRVMANVVLIDVQDIAGNVGVDGNAEAFTMRFQLAF